MLHANSYFPQFIETENYVKRNFEILKIIDIANIKKGKEAGSENYKTNLFENDYAFIRSSDIINNEIDLYPDYFITEKLAKELKVNIIKEDIVFFKDGKIMKLQ